MKYIILLAVLLIGCAPEKYEQFTALSIDTAQKHNILVKQVMELDQRVSKLEPVKKPEVKK